MFYYSSTGTGVKSSLSLRFLTATQPYVHKHLVRSIISIRCYNLPSYEEGDTLASSSVGCMPLYSSSVSFILTICQALHSTGVHCLGGPQLLVKLIGEFASLYTQAVFVGPLCMTAYMLTRFVDKALNARLFTYMCLIGQIRRHKRRHPLYRVAIWRPLALNPFWTFSVEHVSDFIRRLPKCARSTILHGSWSRLCSTGSSVVSD